MDGIRPSQQSEYRQGVTSISKRANSDFAAEMQRLTRYWRSPFNAQTLWPKVRKLDLGLTKPNFETLITKVSQVAQERKEVHIEPREGRCPAFTLLLQNRGFLLYVEPRRKAGREENLLGQGSFKKTYIGIRIWKSNVRPVPVQTMSLKCHEDPDMIRKRALEIDALATKIAGRYLMSGSLHQVEYSQGTETKLVFYGRPRHLLDGSLIDLLINEPLSENQLNSILLQMAQAAHAMHLKGYLHLDIKPDNYLYKQIGNHFRIKLTDYDFALRTDRRRTRGQGTPGYVAPEIVHHKGKGPIPHTRACDVYSLGVSYYRMMSHLLETSGWSREFRDLVAAMVSDDPSKRPSLPEVISFFSQ